MEVSLSLELDGMMVEAARLTAGEPASADRARLGAACELGSDATNLRFAAACDPATSSSASTTVGTRCVCA